MNGERQNYQAEKERDGILHANLLWKGDGLMEIEQDKIWTKGTGGMQIKMTGKSGMMWGGKKSEWIGKTGMDGIWRIE